LESFEELLYGEGLWFDSPPLMEGGTAMMRKSEANHTHGVGAQEKFNKSSGVFY
jgi:hypothetical protein